MAELHDISDIYAVFARTVGFHWGLTAIAAVLIYGPLRTILASRKIAPHGPPLRLVLRHELPWSFLTLLVASLITCTVAWLWQRGWLSFASGPASPLRIVAEVALYLACYDLYFYWFHRLLHTDPWYRLVHHVHHVSKAPAVTSAFVFHPVEAALTGGFVLPLFTLYEFHRASVVGIGIVGASMAIIVHSGYDLLPKWWSRNRVTRLLVSPAFHHRHHELERCHYGAFTVLMDRWFGTLHHDDDHQDHGST